jgi:hypothetical protein
MQEKTGKAASFTPARRLGQGCGGPRHRMLREAKSRIET